MKVAELIKRLKRLEYAKNGAIAYIDHNGYPYNFTGASVDDNGDITLYVASGDKPA